MNDADSLCEVIENVKCGDEEAAFIIWDRFFPQVVRLAGQQLNGRRHPVADEEDVAISVMESFFRAARLGRFPDLKDPDGIWRLLSSMTMRKVIDQVRRNSARPAVGENSLDGEGMGGLASKDPTPSMLAIVTEEVERLFAVLPQKYHAIALKKLECRTVLEIAQECGVHVSTVERRLRIIREFWGREFGDSS